MTASFSTLGCKLNQSETEALAQAFRRAGFRIGRPADEADIVIVNSCTVTGRSDAKSRQALRRAAALSPDALVILTGCYAEVERETLAAEYEKDGIAVVGQSAKPLLMGLAGAVARESGFSDFTRTQKFDFIRSLLGRDRPSRPDPFALEAGESFFRTRSFLKIQDGCDARCAYCRVPLARGNSVSLDIELVLERMARAVGRGAAEIVLTGVNIGAYKSRGTDLTELLTRALRRTRGVRFRLSSLEPDGLTSRLLDALAEPAVCPHFHLSVQSGSAAILARMRRRYGPEALRAGVIELRRRRPDAFIAADVIVGFPGETDAEYGETRRLLHESPLDALHVFPFSPRPGTAAFSFPDRVPSAAIKDRVRALCALGADMTDRFLSRLRGKTIEVILEKKTASGAWTGSSQHSVKCRVAGIPPGVGFAGRLVRGRVVESGRPCRAEFIEEVDVRPEFASVESRESKIWNA
ncbi:MAG: tRNA (N(6)-L-threonylcarbamoyladenosine(37)-C(2))-methylthiotransferase MtaB [Spirochaetales bacterium]|nr:tRNA (N(6)-L-threonylcarbamoyladenosine(37)-C(2))-methylthiotransferase MtaB [Spirochaetales bacterium]